MTMNNPFEGKEIWFGVGSQDLYGEEALRQVAQQSTEIVDALNASGRIPVKLVLKPTLKSSDGVRRFMVDASADDNCIGVITWMHTFSPAKMWIRGLEALKKPLLQLNTQHHFEIPWDTIDMDFMNLNQAAHGDREYGYIVTRLGIPRKIVVGHYTVPAVADKIGVWARACAGWQASNTMNVMRWGDNMRNVAVTEGDKTEAERVFGASINTWAVNELVAAYDGIPRKIVVGHYTDPAVADKIGVWARACAGWQASNTMNVMRWGDNMRNVAVTEGDKTEAERVFGASINTWAVNELVAAYDAVSSVPRSTPGRSMSSSRPTMRSRKTRSRTSSRTTRRSTRSRPSCWTGTMIRCSSRPARNARW